MLLLGLWTLGLRGPLCVAPSLHKRYSTLFDLWVHVDILNLLTPIGLDLQLLREEVAIQLVAFCLGSSGLFGICIIM